MSSPTVIIKTAPGETPYEELDLTDKVNIIERAPTDNDAVIDNYRGQEERFTRGMQRNLALDIVDITNEEAQTLRRWKHGRKRLTVNGNYNGDTILYHRFARSDPADFGVGVTIGPDPTFSRTSGGANSQATFRGRDGKFHLIDDDVPRYEWDESGGWGPIQGMYFGDRVKNEHYPTLPGSAGALWTLLDFSGTATYTLNSDLQAQFEEVTGGSYEFYGNLTGGPDYLRYDVPGTPGVSAEGLSIGLWVRGFGSFQLQVVSAGGAVGGAFSSTESLTTARGWVRLTIENVDHLLSSDIRLNLYAQSDGARCQVGNVDVQTASVLSNTIYNTGAPALIPSDVLVYTPLPVDPFMSMFMVGIRTPDTWPSLAGSEDMHVLNYDFGGGNEFYLRYDASAAKWAIQKYSGEITWAAVKGNSEHVFIAGILETATLIAYEDSATAVTSGANPKTQDGAAELTIGSPDNTATKGALKSTIIFVRVDSPLRKQFIDAGLEVARAFSLYDDADQRYWTKICEGRHFEISSPTHKIVAGIQRNRVNLTEVNSIITATTEDF